MERDAKATWKWSDIQDTWGLTDEQMEQCPIGAIEGEMIDAGRTTIEEWVYQLRLAGGQA